MRNAWLAPLFRYWYFPIATWMEVTFTMPSSDAAIWITGRESQVAERMMRRHLRRHVEKPVKRQESRQSITTCRWRQQIQSLSITSQGMKYGEIVSMSYRSIHSA